MILGMSVEMFTVLHVVISIAAILAGLVLVAAMSPTSAATAGWSAFFLLTTILTSVTGLLLPLKGDRPAAYRRRDLAGGPGDVSSSPSTAASSSGSWRRAFIVTAILALYLNCFVLVVQLFQKIPALNAFAPTGTEPPFVAAQGATLLLFLVLGFLALRRYRPVL